MIATVSNADMVDIHGKNETSEFEVTRIEDGEIRNECFSELYYLELDIVETTNKCVPQSGVLASEIRVLFREHSRDEFRDFESLIILLAFEFHFQLGQHPSHCFGQDVIQLVDQFVHLWYQY